MATKQQDLETVKAALEAVLANDAKPPRQRKGLAAIDPYWNALRTLNRCWKAFKDEPWANVAKCRSCIPEKLSMLIWKLETDIENGKQ